MKWWRNGRQEKKAGEELKIGAWTKVWRLGGKRKVRKVRKVMGLGCAYYGILLVTVLELVLVLTRPRRPHRHLS